MPKAGRGRCLARVHGGTENTNDRDLIIARQVGQGIICHVDHLAVRIRQQADGYQSGGVFHSGMGCIHPPRDTATGRQINQIVINDSARQKLIRRITIPQARDNKIARITGRRSANWIFLWYPNSAISQRIRSPAFAAPNRMESPRTSDRSTLRVVKAHFAMSQATGENWGNCVMLNSVTGCSVLSFRQRHMRKIEKPNEGAACHQMNDK
ncbi:hypothetical protein ACOQFT_14760 [Ruegeria sp. MALMAid1280]